MKRFNPDRLMNLRKGLGITMDAFAKKVDPKLTRQAIDRWEKGRNGPTLVNLAKISTAFDVPIDYFFGQDIYYGRKQCPTTIEP